MTDTGIHQASWDMVDSFHETNQSVANHFVAILDSNLKFAQNHFLIGIEALESQTKNARHLTDHWMQQLPKQQEAFYHLLNATWDVYLNFLRIPFTFYQTVVNATGPAMQRSMQFAHHETQQPIKAGATASQREQAQLWTFEHPLQEAENHRPVLIRAKGPAWSMQVSIVRANGFACMMYPYKKSPRACGKLFCWTPRSMSLPSSGMIPTDPEGFIGKGKTISCRGGLSAKKTLNGQWKRASKLFLIRQR